MSLRAILIGVIGVVAVCAVVAGTELVYVKAGFLQLPPAALGGLLLLVGARQLTQRSKRWRLEAHELAAIYGMMLVAALVSSRGLIEKMLPLLVAPNYFASATNHWQELFFPHTKRWLVAFDPAGPPVQSVARAYYEILPAGQPIPWQAWVVPLLAWSVLAGLIFYAFLCLASLLRRPWMENERLAFPLAQLPLEMVRDDAAELGGSSKRGHGAPPLLRNPLTWLGFALPGIIYTLNGLHTWYPAVPYLEQPFVLNQFFTDRPWSAITWMPVYVSFAAIGLLYLVPGPLLFSLWFFFLVTRLEDLIAAVYGYEPASMPFFPCRRFVGYQTMGAYTVLAGYLLYAAGPRLRSAMRAAIRPGKEAKRPTGATGKQRSDSVSAGGGVGSPPSPPILGGAEHPSPKTPPIIGGLGGPVKDGTPLTKRPEETRRTSEATAASTDPDELMSDRAALGGLLFCVVGMSVWCALAGLSFWWALAQWTVYLFVVMLVLARSTAEGGLIATEVSFRPMDFYAMTSSVQNLGLANMTAMGFLDAAWFRDQRGMVFAGILDAMRIGRGTGLRRRPMLGALVGALLLATLCSILIQIWLPYRRGALQFYGYLFQGNPIWGFQYYQGQWNDPSPFGWEGAFFFGVGVAVTLALTTLRALLPWWPLHPLGYALCGSWTMILLWFPCLLTWLFKGLLLRYGGMPAFVRLRPVFLGMILGEFTMAIFWTALGALTDAPAPVFPWP